MKIAAVQTISKFNLTYSVENAKIAGKSKFFESIHKKKDKVYANEDVDVWYIISERS